MGYEAKSVFKKYVFNTKPILEVLSKCSGEFVGPALVIIQL